MWPQGPDRDGKRPYGVLPSPLERGLRRSGLNVPRSIQGLAQVAQQKMAQRVSTGAMPAEMRPMKDPAENLQALGLALGAGVALDGVVAPVMAVQVQGAVLAEAEVVHPEGAIVQQGVGFALDHFGHAQVHGQGGLQWDQRGHVGGRHGQADGTVRRNAQRFQCFGGQAQVFAGDGGKQAVLQCVEGHLQHAAAVC